jgi:predicted enzyme related to lactoylglutathione lyase
MHGGIVLKKVRTSDTAQQKFDIMLGISPNMSGPSYFEIQADNIEGAVDFYHQVFGWKFTKAEGLPVEYWRIETDGLRGGLLKRPAPAPPGQSGTNAYVCSMEVSDFDDVTEKILAHGGRVALPRFAVIDVCWQGYFIDPEGNTFGLFQPDPKAK